MRQAHRSHAGGSGSGGETRKARASVIGRWRGHRATGVRDLCFPCASHLRSLHLSACSSVPALVPINIWLLQHSRWFVSIRVFGGGFTLCSRDLCLLTPGVQLKHASCQGLIFILSLDFT